MAQRASFQMRVSDEWLAMVDEARGVLTRSAFVKLAVSQMAGTALATVSHEQRRGAVPVMRTFEPQAPPVDEPAVEVPLPKIAPRGWAR